MARLVFAIAVCLAIADFFSRSVARAEEASDGSDAAMLFQQGKELMDQRRYAEACPKLARSRTLERQVGTTLNLALCYERLGKTASSWAMWLSGATEAAEKGQWERETLARRRAALLEWRLLRVTILVAPQEDMGSIDLQLDGEPVPRSRWGAPTPVDPGPHWVQALAPGKRPWVSTVEVDEEHVPIVQVSVLEPMGQATREAPRPTRASGRKTAAILLTGAGIAALVGMSALALVAKSTYQSAPCSGNDCNKTGVDRRDEANVEAGLATVLGVSAVTALAGAAVVAYGWPASPRSATVQTSLGTSAVGLSFRGRW
jgi:Tfp pilus assembly protein PilV